MNNLSFQKASKVITGLSILGVSKTVKLAYKLSTKGLQFFNGKTGWWITLRSGKKVFVTEEKASSYLRSLKNIKVKLNSKYRKSIQQYVSDFFGSQDRWEKFALNVAGGSKSTIMLNNSGYFGLPRDGLSITIKSRKILSQVSLLPNNKVDFEYIKSSEPGLGRQHLGILFNELKQLGFKEVTFDAFSGSNMFKPSSQEIFKRPLSGSKKQYIGGYVWAILGGKDVSYRTNFDRETSVNNFKYYVEKKYKKILSEDILNKLRKPIDIATFKIDGNRVGREFLLDDNWSGVYSLDNFNINNKKFLSLGSRKHAKKRTA